jgi:adenosylhomocysteinase
MDMSFALQALSAKYINDQAGKLKPSVYNVPIEIDKKVAHMKLKALSMHIDILTAEQEDYLKSWDE